MKAISKNKKGITVVCAFDISCKVWDFVFMFLQCNRDLVNELKIVMKFPVTTLNIGDLLTGVHKNK